MNKVKNQNNCPFCQSDNVELIDNMKHLAYDYNKNGKKGRRFYRFWKSLCLNCGAVYEYMEKGILDAYKEDKPYLS